MHRQIVIGMDVLLHYRRQNNLPQLLEIAEKAIEKFPTRPLPRFKPWFPHSDSKPPLTPTTIPPVISPNEVARIEHVLFASQPLVASQSYDCTDGLQEFCTDLKRHRFSHRASSVHLEAAVLSEERTFNEAREFKRSWSVSVPGRLLGENVQPFSKEFQQVLEGFQLHSLQRAKWVIEECNCKGMDLESVWTLLSRAMRHSKLPTCNANIQRDLGQIWIFCDILYCEYVANFLKQHFQLAGKLSLVVHKHGNIFSM